MAHTPRERQALRMRRFLMALSTYVLGASIMALCAALGLLPWARWAEIAVLFVVINGLLGALFASGVNLRFADPSLTALQVCIGVTVVAVILVRGRDLHFVALPFYSVVFVFAMLRLQARELAAVAAYMMISYCAAVWLRWRIFGGALDLRVESVTAALVVGGAIWFAVAAGYISNLRRRLRESLQQIEQLALRDALTGVWNRRQLDALLDAEIVRAQRHGTPLAVLLIDIDHFKSINDRHGHAAGDAVLKSVAAGMAGALRAVDQLGRFGGEEFLALLPATTMAQALACAERLRAQVAGLRPLPGEGGGVTASLGVAAWCEGEDAAALIARADRAMYRAKNGGRDRVEADEAG